MYVAVPTSFVVGFFGFSMNEVSRSFESSSTMPRTPSTRTWTLLISYILKTPKPGWFGIGAFNVLFSASYRSDSGLAVLWHRKGAALLTSAYAVDAAGLIYLAWRRFGVILPRGAVVAERAAISRGWSDDMSVPARPPEGH